MIICIEQIVIGVSVEMLHFLIFVKGMSSDFGVNSDSKWAPHRQLCLLHGVKRQGQAEHKIQLKYSKLECDLSFYKLS